MWDTAGQEKYRSVAKGYFRNANACIIVYDVNNRMTFKSLEFWMNEFQEGSKMFDKDIEKKPILVLGNKIDVDDSYKQIAKEELEKFGQDNGVIVEEVSAKKNAGKQIQRAIDKLMDFLVVISISIYTKAS